MTLKTPVIGTSAWVLTMDNNWIRVVDHHNKTYVNQPWKEGAPLTPLGIPLTHLDWWLMMIGATTPEQWKLTDTGLWQPLTGKGLYHPQFNVVGQLTGWEKRVGTQVALRVQYTAWMDGPEGTSWVKLPKKISITRPGYEGDITLVIGDWSMAQKPSQATDVSTLPYVPPKGYQALWMYPIGQDGEEGAP